MSRSKESEDQGEHGKAKLAAEIGAAGLGLAGAGAAAVYFARKKRTKDLQTYEQDDHGVPTPRTAVGANIFEEPRLSLERRKLIADLAVRIHFATFDTADVIEPKVLRGLIGDQVRRRAFQTAASYLMDKGLIDLKPAGDGSRRRGYQAQPSLDEAIRYGDYPILADAATRMWDQNLNEAVVAPDSDYPLSNTEE